MHANIATRWLIFLSMLAGLLNLAASPRTAQTLAESAPPTEVAAYELIAAMNMLRMSYGNPALIEDPIINAVAQSTAEIMAANQMSWHIGNVAGRLASAGYGGGARVQGTENFAVGYMSIDEIMAVWADASHMLPAVNPAYCNVGAGVAKSANGRTYYVLQAAYISGKACGAYTSTGGTTNQPGGSTSAGGTFVSQWIVPVKIATADPEGMVYHVVETGQSFWSIAVAYKITIKDLETWNNISRDSKLQVGQRLFIPSSKTQGYATPTPVGMVQTSTPDSDGRIIHTVEAYQNLSSIAKAYKVDVQTILNLNGLQLDWPLQIGQKLIIYPGAVTPSPTPRPLTPIEKLTPASDGKYYHTVRSGESLSWIADLYEIRVFDLMGWNGLNEGSILQPDQKLVLQVTPPATATATPGPPTDTPTPTATHPTRTPTRTPAQVLPSPTPTEQVPPKNEGTQALWYVLIAVAASGIVMVGLLMRKRG